MADVMSDPTARFYVIEHLTGMLIAIILLHIGKAQGRKPIGDKAKHRRTVIYYTIASASSFYFLFPGRSAKLVPAVAGIKL